MAPSDIPPGGNCGLVSGKRAAARRTAGPAHYSLGTAAANYEPPPPRPRPSGGTLGFPWGTGPRRPRTCSTDVRLRCRNRTGAYAGGTDRVPSRHAIIFFLERSGEDRMAKQSGSALGELLDQDEAG